MTTRHKIELESIIIFPLVVALGAALAFYTNNKLNPPKKFSLPSMEINEIQDPAPNAVLIPQETISQITPDGEKKVSMVVTKNEDFSKDYIITASDSDGSNSYEIYSSKNTNDILSIPFNTWSPDNVYLFINRSSSSKDSVLVFRGDGQPIDEAYKSVNVTDEFNSKITNVSYAETTGWAANNLLIINTVTSDGAKGNSFWFEVPSKAIISLSTNFY